MRAHFIESLELSDHYILTVDDTLHHLLRVVRIEVGEELLLLNGKGLHVKTMVEGISKRELKLKTNTLLGEVPVV